MYIFDLHHRTSLTFQGCLGAPEEERYSSFVSEDFSYTYDPVEDPAYELFSPTTQPPDCKYGIYVKYLAFLYTACCFGYYHGISLDDWTRFVKTHHV